MDRFNNTFRSMFDLIKTNLKAVGKQLIGNPTAKQKKTKQVKTPIKTTKVKQPVTKSVSKSANKTAHSTTRTTSGRSDNAVDKLSQDSQRVLQTSGQVQPKNLPRQKMSTIFAPRLVHLGTTDMHTDATSADSDQHWISIKSLASENYNCSVYLIHCAAHNKVAVTKPSPTQAMWMPYLPTPSNHCWEDAGVAGLFIILSGANMDLFLSLKDHPPFTENHLMEVFDVPLPHTLEIVTRLMWYVQVDTRVAKSPRFRCCHDTDTLQWIEVKDIVEQNTSLGLEYLWGNELLEKTVALTTYQESGQVMCSTYDEYRLVELKFYFNII